MGKWSIFEDDGVKTTIIRAVDKESGMETTVRFRGTEKELAQEIGTMRSCGYRIVEQS